MPDPKQDNWRTQPAFNYEFESFAECIELAVSEFFRRPSVIFLLLRHNIKSIWLCMPWSQYRSAPADHPCHNATVIFRGNFFDLRRLAYSIPPDLFSAAEAEAARIAEASHAENNPAKTISSPHSGNGDDPDNQVTTDA